MTSSPFRSLSELNVELLIFDFDGTLVDSDEALIQPFIKYGIAREDITFGHAIAPECERLGIPVDGYADAYDNNVVQPYPHVEEMVARLPRWALCSNKHPKNASAEIARLGWQPEVALFADAFDWQHKHLGPVLEAVGLAPSQVAMVGDTRGDESCAKEIGCPMIWAGWNPRVQVDDTHEYVAHHPHDLLQAFQSLKS